MKKRSPTEYALFLLSRRPRTEQEVVVALKRRGVDDEEIAEIVNKLKEWGYLNDQEYARDFVRFKMQKIFGPPVIKSELIKRGISPEIAEQAIRSEYNMSFVMELAVKKAIKLLGNNPDDRTIRKVWNYFARRGLPATEILMAAREKL